MSDKAGLVFVLARSRKPIYLRYRTPLGVQQRLMRHADIQTTMKYGSAFEESKRRANSRVAELILPPAAVEQKLKGPQEDALQSMSPASTTVQ